MQNEILLESGTNELELLEFKVGGNSYGINVAKIKEILPYQKPTPVPNSHPCIEGIFMPRDMVITSVDLAKTLNLPHSENEKNDMYIITKFNKLTVAFHVQEVMGIHRVSWKDIIKPDDTLNDEDSVATGIIRVNGNLIIILDFEKIVFDISPSTGLKVSDVKGPQDKRNNFAILMAEDSHLLLAQMKDCLTKAGYNNIICKGNGQEAWDYLQLLSNNGNLDSVSLVITDIEMPKMDGHRLTKLIKSTPEMSQIPVVIFSSLVTEELRHKGDSLGADAQLSKPEIGQLVDTIDNLLIGKK